MTDGVIFGPVALQGAVKQLLDESAVPPDHRFAAVASFDTNQRVLTTTIAAKVGDDWRIEGSVRHGFDRATGSSVAIVATWK